MFINAAIFDMDGTLIDSLVFWEVLWKNFGDKYCGGNKFTPKPEDDRAIRTMTLKDAMDFLHTNYGIAASGKELLDVTNEMMLDFYKNTVTVKPGVKDFLEHCYSNGIKMCLATATALDLVNIALKSCGLEKYFSRVFSCAVLGMGKDKPDIYLCAQEYLETKTEEIWVFEDSFTALETAKSIGMKTVGIYDKCNPYQDKIKEISDQYIAQGETLLKLI
ncbi:MAG: HAD family hydrolase [Clostridia bacterium]|nr:HAD family hydrolase [Clostridia bacterium]